MRQTRTCSYLYLILERLFEVRLGSSPDDASFALMQPLVPIAQVTLDVRVRYFTVHAIHATSVRYLFCLGSNNNLNFYQRI